MKPAHIPCCAAFLLGVALGGRTALAGDTKLAEELFREGKALLQAGDSAQACPKLGESYRQDPATGTLLALAFCEEQEGKLASAWATYNSVVGRAQQDGRADRVEAARRRADALESRLSRLTVEVAPEVAALPGLSVTCDGVLLPKAAWGSAMPFDPGEHRITAYAERRSLWQEMVVLRAESDRQLVRITVGPSGLVPVPEAQALPRRASEPPSRRPARSTGRALGTVGVITGAVGVLGIGAGAGFALRALSLDHRSQQDGHCDAAGCDATGRPLNHDALAAGRVATGFFISGGVLLISGITLLVLQNRRRKEATALLSVTPLLSAAGGGLSLNGGF